MVVQNYIFEAVFIFIRVFFSCPALMSVQLFSQVTHTLFQIKVGVRDADFDLKSHSDIEELLSSLRTKAHCDPDSQLYSYSSTKFIYWINK